MKRKIIQKKIDNWSLTLSQKSKIHLPENLENLKQLLLNFKKKKIKFFNYRRWKFIWRLFFE